MFTIAHGSSDFNNLISMIFRGEPVLSLNALDMVYCAVFGCNHGSSSHNCSMFRFSKDLAKNWWSRCRLVLIYENFMVIKILIKGKVKSNKFVITLYLSTGGKIVTWTSTTIASADVIL